MSDELLLRQAPHSVEAEQAVLGSLLIDPDCIPEVIESLVPEDFYIDINRLVFETVCHMFSEGRTIDPVTVLDEMKALGHKESASREYFLQLINTTPTAANVSEYVAIVRGKSMLRRLQGASYEIAEMTRSEQDEPEQVVELAEQKIYAIRQDREVRGFTHITTSLGRVLEQVQALAAEPGKLPGLPTGISALDRAIGGLVPSDLLLLAARPGMGKTSLALNMAMAAARATDKTIAIFSLEMSAEQLVTRLIAAEGLIDSTRLRMGVLSADDWRCFAGASRELAKYDIVIDDDAGVTPAAMKAKCRRLGDKLGLVVIDYLQLLHSERRAEGRVQEVGEISRSLKVMARELRVPVLCCSQLSRGPESRTNKRPMLSDLRESGSIEQDADIVMFIYRDEYYEETPENKNLAELILAKNRHGNTGRIDLQWSSEYTKFVQRDTIHDPGD